LRKFLKGRRRYALLVLVGVGSLAIMGAECQPVKPPPPTGLSIAPTSHDFGNRAVDSGNTAAFTFTVTNHDPGMTRVSVVTGGVNSEDFIGANFFGNCILGVEVGGGTTCTVIVAFDPKTTGAKQASLGVHKLAGGPTATAILTGTGTP
jgi:hypothetical protein